MSIYVKTDAGWEELGVGEGSGGSAWGDFTTNGDEQESGTYGPDAQGRMWKWAEWNEAKDYTVNLTGGLYHVLTVGGGDWGHSAGSNQWQHGQPGLVNEGYWEFGSGDQPITVGHKGKKQQYATQDDLGQPSSIGGYGTQGFVTWGNAKAGRGAQANDDSTGYRSSITGQSLEYAVGNDTATNGRIGARPGRGGQNTNEPTDGCVIIATVTNDESGWNPPGALPGLGTWATITSVWDGSGAKPNRYTYNDGPGGVNGMDWVAFEWADDGDLTTQAGGLVDALIIGGGGSGGGATDGMGGGPGCGGAGYFRREIAQLSETVDVVVGAGGVGSTSSRICNDGENSSLGRLISLGGGRGALTNSTSGSTLSPGASGGGGAYVNYSGNSNGSGVSQGLGNDGGPVWSGSAGGGGGGAATSAGIAGQGGDGFIDTITGSPVGYAGGGWYTAAGSPPVDFGAGHSAKGASGRPGSGSGGAEQGSGGSGVVIVRVPATQAAGVDPTTYNDVTVLSVAKDKAKEAARETIKDKRKKR